MSTKYVNERGMKCPDCGKDKVMYMGQLTPAEGTGTAHQDCKCGACGATWTDQYVLTTIVLFKKGKAKKK